ncbi:Thioredoxin [Corynebacterium occultum]|uniref:Thioredoxin n=1 Tax=Corynebacterium occultum TaxID=2675219 RepID=A0A6B8VNJ5_9CORY|nr:tetratricopeptide repeat protein [Corynebacterium occultum]QGU07102.1 Thioredoxin [Corynebacterium occultum]
MSTPDRFISGAVDLGQIKARAEARQQAPQPQNTPQPGSGPSPHAPESQEVVTFFEVTPENLESEVLRRSVQIPVVVLVGTPRSPESEQLKTDLADLAAAADLKFVVGYVDADTSPEVAQMMGVSALPTVIAIAAGRPLTDFQGGQPREALEQWTNSLVEAVGSQLQGLPEGAVPAGDTAPVAPEPPADPRFEAATEALNAGDFAAAIQAYEDILAKEPKNTEAKQARDSARLLQRLAQQQEVGQDPIAAADADPADVEKAFAAADALIAAGNPEAAFDRLIAQLSRTVGDEKKQVRERLVELFALFEPTDSRVIVARGRMASALY